MAEEQLLFHRIKKTRSKTVKKHFGLLYLSGFQGSGSGKEIGVLKTTVGWQYKKSKENCKHTYKIYDEHSNIIPKSAQ